MTLDLAKFISNSIKTQAKIQHLDVSTKTVKYLPTAIQRLIAKEYGDNYMLDADYVSFFWGDLSKDSIKKLFNVVDKALGKSANKLTETDFKKLPLDTQPIDSEDDQSSSEDAEDANVEQDASNGSESTDGEDAPNGDQLDEDGGKEESAATSKSIQHFFLKITLK